MLAPSHSPAAMLYSRLRALLDAALASREPRTLLAFTGALALLMLAQGAYGVAAGSLGLVADAFHMAFHGAAMATSLWGMLHARQVRAHAEPRAHLPARRRAPPPALTRPYRPPPPPPPPSTPLLLSFRRTARAPPAPPARPQPPTFAFSYGYERYEVLAAFSSALFLLFVCVFVLGGASAAAPRPPCAPGRRRPS